MDKELEQIARNVESASDIDQLTWAIEDLIAILERPDFKLRK